MNQAVRFQSLAGLLFAFTAGISQTCQAVEPVQFNRDIRPILSDNCFHCHGPDSAKRKAKLRLDRDTGLFGQTENGVAVVPGKPDQSEVYTRMISDDEDELMPPAKSNHVLSKTDKDLVKRWILEGAKWEGHWAFIAPKKAAEPPVKNVGWVRNPIDRFILARIEAAGLAPAPEADRRSIARRLSYDLTGLPPDPVEVDAFVKDLSPDAYEKLVDKWLASPRYGEHRAHYWLDAARYADTHGLHFDNYREMWPYREWVINAYNQNMPFNQFSLEQLAGDLLPERTMQQQIATGFVRCGMTTNEGGTIAEENLVLYARDRTETAARVFLGLTMNCAVCHDHKFDPITAKDFYSVSAMFANNTMSALDGNIKDTPPSIVIPKVEDRPAYTQLTTAEVELKKKIEARRAGAKPEFDEWVVTAKSDEVAASLPARELQLHAPLSDGKGDVSHALYWGEDVEIPVRAAGSWKAGLIAEKALAVEQSTGAEIPEAGDFERDESYSIAVWTKLPGNATGAIVARMDDAHHYRGWDLWVEAGKIGTHIIQDWEADDALKVTTAKAVDTSKWHHICLTYNGSSKAAGVKVYVDGILQKNGKPAKDGLKGSIRTKVPLKIGQRSNSSLIANLLVQDLRIYKRLLNPSEVKDLATATRLAGLLAKPIAKRNDAEKKELFDWWANNVDDTTMELNTNADVLAVRMDAIKARGAETLVMQEKPTAPVAFVLYRGEYDKRREQVTANTPAVLPPLSPDAPHNRLGFAEWLFTPEHPLTARVTVNRMWQEIFGTGIVKSVEDFGISGDAPSHPELLDWLAVDFRENNWDVKRMLRLIVTSATYRQSVVVSKDKLEKDPGNRLLSHGPRFRMDAELVRDSALAFSGLLVPTIGGPSVKPYQPDGVWEVVGMPESNTRHYEQDHGDGLYRRSLYTFWKRSGPPASMDTFNAPTRENCTVRRERTNTPLQALVTLNDVQFMEAARVLAEKAIKGGQGVEPRIQFVSSRVLARPMRGDELSICKAAYDDLLKHYQLHADDAKQLLKTGESKRDESIDPRHPRRVDDACESGDESG